MWLKAEPAMLLLLLVPLVLLVPFSTTCPSVQSEGGYVSELCCVFSTPLLHLQHSVARVGCTDFFQATPSTTLHLIPPPPLGAPNLYSFPSLVTSHSSHRGHTGGTSGPTRPFKVERTPRCPPRSVMCPSGNSQLDRPSDHSQLNRPSDWRTFVFSHL